MIKVLIVDDSTFVQKVLTQLLQHDPEITVIGVAGDGQDAVEKVRTLKPDVVTMDIIMPLSDGIWALAEIMRYEPTPVIMVSSVGTVNSEIIEQAYPLGVFDVVQKPKNPQDVVKIGHELVLKVKSASKIDKTRLVNRLINSEIQIDKIKPGRTAANSVVVIGSSAGGPVSLDEILPKFNKQFHAGVIVAQHMPHEFLLSYVNYLSKKCALQVKIAEDGDIVYPGRILFSPGNATIELAQTRKGAVVQITKPAVIIQPCIDKVIESCAKVFKNNTVAVIVSGMGQDGLEGTKVVRKTGGKVVCEDKSTASVYGMPQEVFCAKQYDWVFPSYYIAESVIAICEGRVPVELVVDNGFMIKGIILNTCIDHVKKIFSEQTYARFVDSLSVRLKTAVKEGFSNNHFYASSAYIELCSQIGSYAGEFSSVIREIGAEQAKTVFRIFRLYFNDTKNVCLADLVTKLIKTFVTWITFDVQKSIVQDDLTVITIKNNEFSDKNVCDIFTWIVDGWIKEIFAVYGNGITYRLTSSSGIDEKRHYLKIVINGKLNGEHHG
jgi:two-component system chemotaxis response regulator CheB